MRQRIAIASSDGKVVNQHFGKADKFYIIDIFDNGYKVVGIRETVPLCNNFEHTEKDFERVVTLLADCIAVYVSRIGNEAAQYLDLKGIKSFEMPYPIEDLLNKLLTKK